MNVSVLAVTVLGTFGRTAARPSALAYNPAVIFTLNQNTTWARPEATVPARRAPVACSHRPGTGPGSLRLRGPCGAGTAEPSRCATHASHPCRRATRTRHLDRRRAQARGDGPRPRPRTVPLPSFHSCRGTRAQGRLQLLVHDCLDHLAHLLANPALDAVRTKRSIRSNVLADMLSHGVILRHPPPSGCSLRHEPAPDDDASTLFYPPTDTTGFDRTDIRLRSLLAVPPAETCRRIADSI
jgi:hypothetical protein